MSRKKSSLATYEKISPNKNLRNQNIRRLTPHCVAGNLTIEAILGLSSFQNGGNASTNYAIGTDGKIGLGVEEAYRAWTSSSSTNDHQSITAEISNNGPAPDWRMSDVAINSWINLAVDICKFYGYKKIAYHPKPANITINQVETWIKTWDPGEDTMLITLHQWFAAKACPGPYLIRQLPWITKEINRRLSGQSSEAFVGEGGSNSSINQVNSSNQVVQSSAPKPSTTMVPYEIKVTAAALNVRKGPGMNHQIITTLRNDKNIYTIIEESNGWGYLKSKIGWISLEFTKRT